VNQHDEIKTIKPRSISVQLSEADCERLKEKAALGGMTPGELLSAFVGDLVDGTYSQGSDERMMANDWYDRCGFEETAPRNFLRYLLLTQGADGVRWTVGDWEALAEARNDLLAAAKHPEEYETEEIAGIKEAFEGYQESVNALFADFAKWAETDKPIDQGKEITQLQAWLHNTDFNQNQVEQQHRNDKAEFESFSFSKSDTSYTY